MFSSRCISCLEELLNKKRIAKNAGLHTRFSHKTISLFDSKRKEAGKFSDSHSSVETEIKKHIVKNEISTVLLQ